MPVLLEHAPSGRTKCVVCGDAIAANDLRFRDETETHPERTSSKYCHLRCALESRWEVAHEGLLARRTSPELVRGCLSEIEAVDPALAAEVRARLDRHDHESSLLAPISIRPLGTDGNTARLLAQLEADPEDRDVLAVLADVLQLCDDPRGELIALQLRLERTPQPHDLAWINRRNELFKALAPSMHARWGIGFVCALDLYLTDNLVPHAIWALRHDSSQVLRKLTLRIPDGSAVESLCGALPAAVRTLELLGDLTWAPRLIEAAPALTALTLGGQAWTGILRHARVAALQLHGCAAEVLATLTPADVPALAELEVLPATAAAPDRLELEPLARSRLLAQLTRFSLHVAELTDADLATLVSSRFERLRVVADRLPADARARLERCTAELSLIDKTPGTGVVYVEHANKPEWGRGKLVRRFDDKVEVEFASSTRVFKADAPFLRMIRA